MHCSSTRKLGPHENQIQFGAGSVTVSNNATNSPIKISSRRYRSDGHILLRHVELECEHILRRDGI